MEKSTVFCALFLAAVFHVKISVWSARGKWSDNEAVNDTRIYQYQTARFVVSYPFDERFDETIFKTVCSPLPNVSFFSWHQPYPPGVKAWSLEDNGVYAIVHLTQTPKYLKDKFWVQHILEDAISDLQVEELDWILDPFVYFYCPKYRIIDN